MFGSTVLEVATGLIFIYLLLSLACTVVSEWIAALLALRAKNLMEGVKSLLHDHAGTGLAMELFNHSLIQGLCKAGQSPHMATVLNKKDGPSYIPPRTFAIALLDTLKLLAPAAPQADNAARLQQQVAIIIAATGLNPTLKQGLLALINQAGGDIAKLQQNVETWFDDGMDRASGWYKKQSQAILLGLGLGVAVLMNADTVYIVNTLMHNDAMRASIVADAGKFTAQGQPKDAKAVFDELKRVPLPIGWSMDRLNHINGENWLVAIFGWFFTAAALSLGAPFWFDMLNKIMNMRAAGITPADKAKAQPPDGKPK